MIVARARDVKDQAESVEGMRDATLSRLVCGVQVDKADKKKKPRGRALKRMQYNRRFGMSCATRH